MRGGRCSGAPGVGAPQPGAEIRELQSAQAQRLQNGPRAGGQAVCFSQRPALFGKAWAAAWLFFVRSIGVAVRFSGRRRECFAFCWLFCLFFEVFLAFRSVHFRVPGR